MPTPAPASRSNDTNNPIAIAKKPSTPVSMGKAKIAIAPAAVSQSAIAPAPLPASLAQAGPAPLVQAGPAILPASAVAPAPLTDVPTTTIAPAVLPDAESSGSSAPLASVNEESLAPASLKEENESPLEPPWSPLSNLNSWTEIIAAIEEKRENVGQSSVRSSVRLTWSRTQLDPVIDIPSDAIPSFAPLTKAVFGDVFGDKNKLTFDAEALFTVAKNKLFATIIDQAKLPTDLSLQLEALWIEFPPSAHLAGNNKTGTATKASPALRAPRLGIGVSIGLNADSVTNRRTLSAVAVDRVYLKFGDFAL